MGCGKPITHRQTKLTGLPPLIPDNALLAILGSFPGRTSLQAQQYYAFARNHFWPIVGTLLDMPDLVGKPYAQKMALLHKRRIALWDVYAACIREGSLDADIEAGEPNDLGLLTRRAPGLRVIAHNGSVSARFKKQAAALGVQVIQLPSTSPANASWSFERKLAAWRQAFELAGVIDEYVSSGMGKL